MKPDIVSAPNRLAEEIKLAEQEDDWAQIDMPDVLEHWEEAEVTASQMRKIVEANPDFYSGREFYVQRNADRNHAFYTYQDEVAIHITMEDDFVNVHILYNDGP